METTNLNLSFRSGDNRNIAKLLNGAGGDLGNAARSIVQFSLNRYINTLRVEFSSGSDRFWWLLEHPLRQLNDVNA